MLPRLRSISSQFVCRLRAVAVLLLLVLAAVLLYHSISPLTLVRAAERTARPTSTSDDDWSSRETSTAVVTTAAATTMTLPRERPCRLFTQPPGSSARLGNRMFVHAALFGLARTLGCRPAFYAPENRMLMDIFELSTSVKVNPPKPKIRAIGYPWRTAIYVPLNVTDQRQTIVGDNEDVQFNGYFQSWRYFAGLDDRVRAEFRFRAPVVDAADRKLGQLLIDAGVRPPNKSAAASSSWRRRETVNRTILVGIHVRRSDMAMQALRRRGYTVADEGYIRRAMSHVEHELSFDANATAQNNTGSRLVYVVCTDDSGWARRYVRSARFAIVFCDDRSGSREDAAAVDLAVLASCDHVIVTVGTYGWWAGFLAGGLTVYDRNFPTPNTEIGRDVRPEDYYPPNWVGLT